MYYERNNLLSSLAKEGIKILEIWHNSKPDSPMFFETGVFRHASKETGFHTLTNSKDITRLINHNSSVYANSPTTLKSIINEIERLNELVVTKHFSPDHSFIWHL